MNRHVTPAAQDLRSDRAERGPVTLSRGTRLGPYEIISAIGAGGMGEVFRARDTKLNRDVAIKVLPAAFADDHERVARFRREAQTLASLNHPNIAAIYGIEESVPSTGSGTVAGSSSASSGTSVTGAEPVEAPVRAQALSVIANDPSYLRGMTQSRGLAEIASVHGRTPGPSR